MELKPGDKLGPYEIIAPIGEGGMGEVWRARDTRLDRSVAIKISKTEFSRQFEREAQAIAALNHPNICQIYDVGPNYIVMEYVRGSELKGPVPVARALELAGWILDGLDAAHRKSIVHRDLKPANILVTKTAVKILDFGLAKVQAQAAEIGPDALTGMALSVEGTIVGTLYYMAPEQLQGKDVDSRADIFAFGCVLYEMLTGKRAFEGSPAASVIASILKDHPVPPSTVVQSGVSPALDAVVGACLAKDPEDRWQTARDLKRELVRIGSAEGTEVDASRATRRRDRMWLALLAAAGLACMLLAAGWLLRIPSWRTPPPELSVQASLLAPGDGVNFIAEVNVGGLAFSPDGRNLVFGGELNGKRSLYLRTMESGEARAIPNTENAGKPSFSHDGRSLVFFADAKVKRLDISGGDPVVLASGGNRGMSWNRDGVILFSSNSNAGYESGIWRTSADGGTPVRVTTVNEGAGENAHYWPQFLPDGKHFLFLVRGSVKEKSAIFAGSLEDAPAQARRTRILQCSFGAQFVPAADGGDGYLVFVDGSALFAQRFALKSARLEGERVLLAQDVSTAETNGYADFAVSPDGKVVFGTGIRQQQRLVWRDRSGSTKQTAVDPAIFSDFTVSPDAKNAIVSRTDSLTGTVDLYSADLARGSKTLITRGQTGGFSSGIWSPDGKEIAYDTPQGLFKVGINGVGSPVRLGESARPTSWSRDGRFLLSTQGEGTKSEIWVLPLTGNAKPYPYLQADANNNMSSARFSPDGRWIAYYSKESGAYEVYIQSFPPGRGKWQISTGGGSQPRWRDDGRELFYLTGITGGTGKLMAVSITVSGDRVRAGLPQFLFDCLVLGGSSYGVADNGQQFLIAEPMKAAAKPLTVLLNWRTKFRK